MSDAALPPPAPPPPPPAPNAAFLGPAIVPVALHQAEKILQPKWLVLMEYVESPGAKMRTPITTPFWLIEGDLDAYFLDRAKADAALAEALKHPKAKQGWIVGSSIESPRRPTPRPGEQWKDLRSGVLFDIVDERGAQAWAGLETEYIERVK